MDSIQFQLLVLPNNNQAELRLYNWYQPSRVNRWNSPLNFHLDVDLWKVCSAIINKVMFLLMYLKAPCVQYKVWIRKSEAEYHNDACLMLSIN